MIILSSKTNIKNILPDSISSSTTSMVNSVIHVVEFLSGTTGPFSPMDIDKIGDIINVRYGTRAKLSTKMEHIMHTQGSSFLDYIHTFNWNTMGYTYLIPRIKGAKQVDWSNHKNTTLLEAAAHHVRDEPTTVLGFHGQVLPYTENPIFSKNWKDHTDGFIKGFRFSLDPNEAKHLACIQAEMSLDRDREELSKFYFVVYELHIKNANTLSIGDRIPYDSTGNKVDMVRHNIKYNQFIGYQTVIDNIIIKNIHIMHILDTSSSKEYNSIDNKKCIITNQEIEHYNI